MERMRGNQAKIVQSSPDGAAVMAYSPDGRVTSMSFNKVFDEGTGQADFFEQSGVRDLVVQALHGYAVTIFAFGQTGSGKTFTITGPEGPQTADTVGIVPRALNFMFHQIAAMRDSGQLSAIRVQASYLEIYNEHVQDLLNPQNATLPVRWSAERGFYVENLFIVDCDVLDDSLAVLEEGLRNRTVAAHDMNEHSSRSHSILTIYLETQAMDASEGRPVKHHGKISFVDLAGSEKVKESKASGDTFTEALSINKSLLTLGICISSLADPRKRLGHIPFRDSKLTKLLADSLGGHGMALMIACVSPGAVNMQETFKTLRYAAKARKIQNRPVIQLDPREEMVLILKREIMGLRRENMALRGVIESDPKFAGAAAGIVGVHDDPLAQARSARNASVAFTGGYDPVAYMHPAHSPGYSPHAPSALGMHRMSLPPAHGSPMPSHAGMHMAPSPQTRYAMPHEPGSLTSSMGTVHSGMVPPPPTGRRSTLPSRRAARSRQASTGGHARSGSASHEPAGPPTLATQRVSTLRRSAAPAGQDRIQAHGTAGAVGHLAAVGGYGSGSVRGSQPSGASGSPRRSSVPKLPALAKQSPLSPKRTAAAHAVATKRTNKTLPLEKIKCVLPD
nr:Kinesin- protein 12 [Polyrhizophydium stewartii]